MLAASIFTFLSQENHVLGTMAWYAAANSTLQTDKDVKGQDSPPRAFRYRSYIVRCWQEATVHAGRQTKLWRFSLQDPRTGQRRGFVTLEALLVSLQEELADDKDS
jgi:hypothetical protein